MLPKNVGRVANNAGQGVFNLLKTSRTFCVDGESPGGRQPRQPFSMSACNQFITPTVSRRTQAARLKSLHISSNPAACRNCPNHGGGQSSIFRSLMGAAVHFASIPGVPPTSSRRKGAKSHFRPTTDDVSALAEEPSPPRRRSPSIAWTLSPFPGCEDAAPGRAALGFGWAFAGPSLGLRWAASRNGPASPSAPAAAFE